MVPQIMKNEFKNNNLDFLLYELKMPFCREHCRNPSWHVKNHVKGIVIILIQHTINLH